MGVPVGEDSRLKAVVRLEKERDLFGFASLEERQLHGSTFAVYV
jgi:hypothetical protein